MRYWRAGTWCALSLLVLSCGERTPSQQPVDTTELKTEYEGLAKGMVESVPFVAAPLKELNDEQMAAVAALLVMSRVATRNEGLPSLASATLAEGFWVDLLEVCPPMPEGLGSKLPGCLGPELDYGAAMASCMNSKCAQYEQDTENCDDLKWKYESDCEREHAGELTAAVQCRMEEIEAMRGILQKIPGRKWPPDPFPWPY